MSENNPYFHGSSNNSAIYNGTSSASPDSTTDHRQHQYIFFVDMFGNFFVGN